MDGTASSKSDFVSTAGTLTFPPGTRRLTISISVKSDRVREPDEAFAARCKTTTKITREIRDRATANFEKARREETADLAR